MSAHSVGPVRVLKKGFFNLYPDEAARSLNKLPEEEILRLLREEPVATATDFLVRLNPDTAANLIGLMEEDFFVPIFSAVEPSIGASLLARLDEDTISSRLKSLPPELSREYRELMDYPPDTAGHIMDTRVTTFDPEDTAGEVLDRLRAVLDRRIVDLCITDREGRLTGVVPLQEVAVSPPTLRIVELVRGAPVSMHCLAPREDVVRVMEERRLASLPVVDLDDRLLGIIRYDALVDAAKQEVSEDLQTMFGAGRDERALSKTSFVIKKRLPWLHVNLLTAFLAASVVAIFEDTIARITVLAVFLPVVAGQSGNTGAQALAVTMRGLALREIRPRSWLHIARKEVLVGFVNGCVIALSTSLVVYVWTGSQGLAAVIGTAMVFSMVVAGLSGVIIPLALRSFGQDPAQSSAIILTTITDVVGFVSFLGLGTVLVETLV